MLFQELFKRAENREQLKKRFEIQKKLRIQQKLKGSLTPKKRKSISEDDEPSMAAHEREKEKGINNISSLKFTGIKILHFIRYVKNMLSI